MIHVSPCFCRVVKKVSPNNVTSDRFLTYSLHSNVLGIINQCPPKDSNSTMAYIQCRSCTYRHVRFRQMTYFVDLSIAKDLFFSKRSHTHRLPFLPSNRLITIQILTPNNIQNENVRRWYIVSNFTNEMLLNSASFSFPLSCTIDMISTCVQQHHEVLSGDYHVVVVVVPCRNIDATTW